MTGQVWYFETFRFQTNQSVAYCLAYNSNNLCVFSLSSALSYPALMEILNFYAFFTPFTRLLFWCLFHLGCGIFGIKTQSPKICKDSIRFWAIDQPRQWYYKKFPAFLVKILSVKLMATEFLKNPWWMQKEFQSHLVSAVVTLKDFMWPTVWAIGDVACRSEDHGLLMLLGVEVRWWS